MKPYDKKRPFLKWAGGKFKSLDIIKHHLPDSDCFIEPFVGAGSVFLNTDYPNYILNDINIDLINLFKVVQTKHEDYIKDVRDLFKPENNKKETYYHLREKFNASRDDYERALIFLYLNKFGFNGLCRYNSKGIFNVPFGKYKAVGFQEEKIINFAEKAQNATFYCEDFTKIFKIAPKNAVIYCDPPYVPLNDTSLFTSYHTDGFSHAEQRRLAELAIEGAKTKQQTVLISNHDTLETRQWYNSAHIETLSVRRLISSNGDRPQKNELLAIYTPS
ncbi:Dam family site-specific DNA-(adenine-N6)-methyltransferase [Thorsellia anophelis]|uniref:Site-specific DNA-methyltransferase (adenine-specific) n=1 Tax=Thorsellia anophelis DSM 18579 TaxID=1123402 RepID=A0A1H9Y4V7_9GAMM|nr:Dam family site-specific DNA-(adenine-N6)-methyltransferase [Thorsellia anophelis]SES63865.1 DNA adenine methylase [Thorsellia anophelis DSM 18579]